MFCIVFVPDNQYELVKMATGYRKRIIHTIPNVFDFVVTITLSIVLF